MQHEKDEFFHVPGDEKYWSESHYFHFVGEDVSGHARIGFYPNREQANVWAFITRGETIYYVDEPSVPTEDVHGLVARRDDYTFTYVPETVGEEWRFELEGTVKTVSEPSAVLEGAGDPAEVDVELVLEDHHDIFYYSEGEMDAHDRPDDRYEVACHAEGSAELEGETFEFSGHAERDHSWAPREWAGDAEWLYIAGGFDDGTAYQHTTAWLAGNPEEPVFVNGFWFDGDEVHAITDAEVRADPGFGQETAEAWAEGDAPEFEIDLAWDGGSTTIDVEPFVTTPLEFVNEDNGQRALFNRSGFDNEKADGTTGTGWLENPIQFELE